MKFAMAMVALEQGKKVRITEWAEDNYIYLDCHKEIKDEIGGLFVIGHQPSKYDWELYNESVKLNTLEEGDSFIYNNRKYTVLPAYLKQHCGTMTVDSIPIISDDKRFTNLFGNVIVRKV